MIIDFVWSVFFFAQITEMIKNTSRRIGLDTKPIAWRFDITLPEHNDVLQSWLESSIDI